MTLALLLLSILPREDCVRERVEILETNIVYDFDGNPHLRQLVFWDRHVIAWRMDSDARLNPVGKTLYFMDQGTVRCITARTVVESHTQFDVETADREVWPRELRRELKIKGR